MNAPLFPLLGFYILGIIVGYYLFIPFHFLIVSLFALLVLLLLSLLFRWMIASHILIFCSLITLGIFRINPCQYPAFPTEHIRNFISEDKQVLEGILYRPPEYSLYRTRIYLDLTALHKRERSFPVTGRFLLTIKEYSMQLDSGDRIRFLSKISVPSTFGNPGCFDYAEYLAREGIYATGFLPDDKYLAKMGGNLSFFHFIGRMRERIRETFTENMEPPSRE